MELRKYIKIRPFLLLVGLLALAATHATAQKKMKRSEAFFGFHFDFHAREQDKNLGKLFDVNLLDTFLRLTKPDYIQVDAKGHPGYASYPTTVGYSAESFVSDPMKSWKTMAEKYSLPLVVHYSGLWDVKAVKENPEWARVTEKGIRDTVKAGYLNGYAEKLLIPQLRELIDRYGINGAWIDGDCWVTAPDYSPAAVAGFLKETGLKSAPLDKKDPNYKRWIDYTRKLFTKYVSSYVDSIHRYKPDFEITSNWAYSSMMPIKPEINVDFLSGDVASKNCVYSASFQARCLALQGKPWDLMAWGMVPIDFWNRIYTKKSLVQLQQEASEVMAMGGGFQVYYQQNRDGGFRTLETDDMVKLAQFCRDRQPFSHQSKPIPQIGMWYSLEGWKKNTDKPFGWISNMQGFNSLLLDDKRSVEVLMDHHLTDQMEKYPLIIIPEWDAFDGILKERLLNYVKNGGKLLVAGAKAVKEFEKPLGITISQKDTTKQFLMGGKDLGGIAGIKTAVQYVTPLSGTETIGNIYNEADYRYAAQYPLATIRSYGRGQIAGIYTDLSSAYMTYRSPVYRNLVGSVIDKLLPNPMLKVSGSTGIHTVLSEKNGDILIHLVNASGAHSDEKVYSYDDVAPTSPLKVKLTLAKRPKQVLLQPGNIKLESKYTGNTLELTIPAVDIYNIVQVIP